MKHRQFKKQAIFFKPVRKVKNEIIFRKICLWWLGNLVFGLIPLISVGLINFLNLNDKANQITNEDIEHLFNDGVINFFCLAIIGAISVDIYSIKEHFREWFVRVMKWGAIGIGVSVAFIYIGFVLTTDAKGHFGDIKPLSIMLVITALIYCTIGKINLILVEVN